jgi:hypothetical protein
MGPVEVEGVRRQGPGQLPVRVDQARRSCRARSRPVARVVRVAWRTEPRMQMRIRGGGDLDVWVGVGGGRRRVSAP